jgi:release factor glutamine methyltransferase
MRYLLADNWRTYGVDSSEAAVALARDNVDSITQRHEDQKPPTEVWRADTMKDDFPEETVQKMVGKCHILTANPPYIPYEQYIDLSYGVRAFEDINALLGDGTTLAPLEERKGDGLTHYRRIASLLPKLLVPRYRINDSGLKDVPRVALEIGFDQGEAVQDILKAGSGVVTRTECWKDQYHQDRLVVGWL